MNQQQFFHEFWNYPEGLRKLGNLTIDRDSRNGLCIDRAKYYGTTIAIHIYTKGSYPGECRNGDTNLCVLTTYNGGYALTAKAIYYAINACPFDTYSDNVMIVKNSFLDIGDFYTYRDITFSDDLLKRKADREHIRNLYNTACDIIDHKEELSVIMNIDKFENIVKDEKLKEFISKCYEIDKKLYERRTRERTPEELKKLERARERKKEKLQDRIDKFCALDINERLKIIFDKEDHRIDDLKKLSGIGKNTWSYTMKRNVFSVNEFIEKKEGFELSDIDYSYVFIRDNDSLYTSKNVTMPIETVKPLLILWKEGHDLVGRHIGPYIFQERNESYTKIGCHKIPNWNIELLYNRLIKDETT